MLPEFALARADRPRRRIGGTAMSPSVNRQCEPTRISAMTTPAETSTLHALTGVVMRLHPLADGVRSLLCEPPDDESNGHEHDHVHQPADDLEDEPKEGPEDQHSDSEPDERVHESFLSRSGAS